MGSAKWPSSTKSTGLITIWIFFINAYIKGRQEARRDWYCRYAKNPDVYERDAEQHRHGSFIDDNTN
jgi:hypothetical protein